MFYFLVCVSGHRYPNSEVGILQSTWCALHEFCEPMAMKMQVFQHLRVSDYVK